MASTDLHATRLLLTRRECADALGISERTVFDLTKNGTLPCVKLGPRGIRYPLAALQAFIESQLSATKS